MPGRGDEAAEQGARKRRPRSLKERAIALLARREYARAELRVRLLHGASERGLTGVAVDALLDELAALGYLSDARYAQSLVRRRQGSHSRRAITEELAAQGVAPALARDAVDALAPDDATALRELWTRRFGHPPVDEREKARQVRFLQTRGFRLSDILKLLRELPASD